MESPQEQEGQQGTESRYGFATRCEATAPPRRNAVLSLRAVPLVRSVTLCVATLHFT